MKEKTLFLLFFLKLSKLIGTIFLVIIGVFIFSSALLAQEKNPLLETIGKPYSEYHPVREKLVDSLFFGDSLSRAELMRLYDETALADKSGKFELERRMLEYDTRFFESRNGGLIPSSDYTAEELAEDMLAVAGDAQKRGFRFIRIRALFYAAEAYRIFAQDYGSAFDCYLAAAAELENTTLKEFPMRSYIYLRIADLYYAFREYEESIAYYRKALEDPGIVNEYYRSFYSAMNGLGLCYRYRYEPGDYERSDSCFNEIIKSAGLLKDKLWIDTWEGIAEGNIGFNCYLLGDLDTALFWLIPAIDKINRPHDSPYVSTRAANIADIYLKKDNPVLARKYIDIALEYHRRSGDPEKSSRLFDVLSKYYSYTGDRLKAITYHDSTVMAKNRENEAFSGLVLRRIEQQLRAADNKIHEQALNEEKIRSRNYMNTAIIVSAALLVIFILLVLTFLFYRRKRNAYRELVRRSQSWAGVSLPENKEIIYPESDVVNSTNGNTHKETEAALHTENDMNIMERVEKAISAGKLYKNADLTLDVLAAEIQVNRYYISGALNRCTGKNFNTYVNDYRIKEAILIMSEAGNSDITIDAVAFESGFNDRKNFYKVFKKITGLSPTEFRRNMINADNT